MRIPGRLPVLLLALGLLAAAGCGRRGGGGGNEGNTLRYALQSPPTTLDPAMVQDGDTIDLLMQVFEGLVQWNDKNEVVPNIAEKWDLSPDGRVYTFHLRDDVYFHAPFRRRVTAADFVYSITRALLPKTKSPTAQTYLFDIAGAADVYNGKAGVVAGLKAVDDRTLQITIDKRRPYFLGKLTYPTAYVISKEAIEKNSGQFDEKTMIGTGPFKLSQYQAGYEVRLAANAEYHGGKPILDGIRRPILPDSYTRQTTFESGGTDITDIQRADLERIQADPTLSKELKTFPRAAIWYLALNQASYEPFKKKAVRQAFAMAIDKDELIRLALRGTGKKAEGVLPPGVPGHDPAFMGLPYDPAKARQLLAQAGFPGGQGLPKFTISYRQGYKQIADAVLAIRDDLKRNLGVEADVRQVEWASFLTEMDNEAMPCWHHRWAADYLDPQDFLSVMFRTGAQENHVGYSNPAFDRLCDQADVEPDPQRRLALYRQAEKLVVDDAPWVCIYFQEDIELHKPYVKGIRDSLMGHLPHVTTTVAR